MTPLNYWSTSPADSQSPSKVSFHKVTLSLPLMAKILPLRDQEALQQTSGNFSFVSNVFFHWEIGVPSGFVSLVHISTVLSWLAVATYDLPKLEGDQATSRTQSVWPCKVSSKVTLLPSELNFQILTKLSQPPVTILLSSIFLPSPIQGAQVPAFTPIEWASNKNEFVFPSGKNSTTDARPSLEVHNNKAPYSAGAHDIEFTEAPWTLCSVIVDQTPFSSFQTKTRPS